MTPKVQAIRDVAERHLCTGCGVCAYLQPQSIVMRDVPDQGLRPVVADGADTREALGACPGISLVQPTGPDADGLIRELWAGWGPVLEVWEGHAADPEIRFLGSSGGAATALSLYGLEAGGLAGVLHTVAREEAPHLNCSALARTRSDLLRATGSRYAPASPCADLDRIERAEGPCLFVGKPCDVAAARSAAAARPGLEERLAVTVAIFCAGTPSTEGTLELLRRMGVEPEELADLRYRGKGWPGHAEATPRGGESTPRSRMTYAESWGLLSKYKQWRCNLCADHTGEFADISVGDPWYRDIPPDDPGSSLVVARTPRGREYLRRAREAGYLELRLVEAELLPASQPNLLRTRGAVWGRILTCRLMGLAVPRYEGIRTWPFWLRTLSLRQRWKSIVGTLNRIRVKRLHRRAAAPAGRGPAETEAVR